MTFTTYKEKIVILIQSLLSLIWDFKCVCFGPNIIKPSLLQMLNISCYERVAASSLEVRTWLLKLKLTLVLCEKNTKLIGVRNLSPWISSMSFWKTTILQLKYTQWELKSLLLLSTRTLKLALLILLCRWLMTTGQPSLLLFKVPVLPLNSEHTYTWCRVVIRDAFAWFTQPLSYIILVKPQYSSSKSMFGRNTHRWDFKHPCLLLVD